MGVKCAAYRISSCSNQFWSYALEATARTMPRTEMILTIWSNWSTPANSGSPVCISTNMQPRDLVKQSKLNERINTHLLQAIECTGRIVICEDGAMSGMPTGSDLQRLQIRRKELPAREGHLRVSTENHRNTNTRKGVATACLRTFTHTRGLFAA